MNTNLVASQDLTSGGKIELDSKHQYLLQYVNAADIDLEGSTPIIGAIIRKFRLATHYEALAAFVPSGDPVLEIKMKKALQIRDYEMQFGLVSGLVWGGIFACLPALRGFSMGTRALFFTVPFSLVYYRGFRRGYGQVIYVGEVYSELLCKQKLFLENIGQTQGFLAELKESPKTEPLVAYKMRIFGIKPFS